MADDPERRARKFGWGPGDLRVVTADGRRVTVAEFLAEREDAAEGGEGGQQTRDRGREEP